MVNFGPLAAEIDPVVWGTPANFIGLASWQRYCTASSSGRQPNFAALNRERHLCSAGRPSHWALAHILVIIIIKGWAGGESCWCVQRLLRSWRATHGRQVHKLYWRSSGIHRPLDSDTATHVPARHMPSDLTRTHARTHAGTHFWCVFTRCWQRTTADR